MKNELYIQIVKGDSWYTDRVGNVFEVIHVGEFDDIYVVNDNGDINNVEVRDVICISKEKYYESIV